METIGLPRSRASRRTYRILLDRVIIRHVTTTSTLRSLKERTRLSRAQVHIELECAVMTRSLIKRRIRTRRRLIIHLRLLSILINRPVCPAILLLLLSLRRLLTRDRYLTVCINVISQITSETRSILRRPETMTTILEIHGRIRHVTNTTRHHAIRRF